MLSNIFCFIPMQINLAFISNIISICIKAVTYNKRPEIKWHTQQKRTFFIGYLSLFLPFVVCYGFSVNSFRILKKNVFECFLRKYSFCCSGTLHRGQSLHILSWMSLWWTSFARILLLSQFIWVDWWAISITLDSWIDVRHRISVCPGICGWKKRH